MSLTIRIFFVHFFLHLPLFFKTGNHIFLIARGKEEKKTQVAEALIRMKYSMRHYPSNEIDLIGSVFKLLLPIPAATNWASFVCDTSANTMCICIS